MNRILLVEGIDDQHVVLNLAKHHNLPQVFVVDQKQGYTNLLKILPVQIKSSNTQAIGVLLDADVDFLGRWQSVRDLLTNSGYVGLPVQIPKEGLIAYQEGLPRIGVWLMPDNMTEGMLEDFIVKLVPEEDPLISTAVTSVHNIPKDHKKFSPLHLRKAEIHTWLAWQQDPGTPFGLAITKKYLDPDCPSSRSFVDWLEQTFVAGF